MPTESLTAPERETTITTTDEDETVTIWTAQRTVISSLRRKPDSFAEIASGFHGSTEWAQFTISVNDVNWAALAKRKGTPRPNAAANLWSRSSTGATSSEEAA